MPIEPVGHRIFIGIDPGASGGLAVTGLLPVVDCREVAIAMPATERDVWEWLAQWAPTLLRQPFAVIEKVGGYMPGSGGNIGSAMFRFGHNYGGLRMALVGLGIPFEEVPPRQWQKALGIAPRKRTESRGAWKSRLKAMAQQLFPRSKATLATADAMLLAEHCRRKRQSST